MKKNENTLRFQSETTMRVTLDLMGFLETGPGWRGDRHEHSFWELVFVETGRGVLWYRRAQRRIHAGDLFLFPPHIEHQFAPDPDAISRHLYMGFTLDRGFPALPQHIVLPLLDKQHALSVVGDLAEIVSRMVARKEKAQLDKCSGDVLSVLLKLISGLVLGAESAEEESSRSAILTEKVKGYLAGNLERNISVTSLARSLYLSPHYVGDLFKHHAGMTIKEYHNFLRLKESERMLHDPERQVSEIADALGYSSIHYFSRKFKQYYGVSPSAFREQLHL